MVKEICLKDNKTSTYLLYHDGKEDLTAVTNLPHLEMFEVGSFLIHHLGQKLVLKTISGHSEIDEGGLGLNFGLVVRIGQFGVEDESEAGVEETLLVSNLYTTVREWPRWKKRNAWEERAKK